MGGGGSMAAMNASLKANKNLRRKRPSLFKQDKVGSSGYKGKLKDSPKMSQAQKRKFVDKLKQDKYKSDLSQILIFSGVLLAVIALVYYLFF